MLATTGVAVAVGKMIGAAAARAASNPLVIAPFCGSSLYRILAASVFTDSEIYKQQYFKQKNESVITSNGSGSCTLLAAALVVRTGA